MIFYIIWILCGLLAVGIFITTNKILKYSGRYEYQLLSLILVVMGPIGFVITIMLVIQERYLLIAALREHFRCYAEYTDNGVADLTLIDKSYVKVARFIDPTVGQ